MQPWHDLAAPRPLCPTDCRSRGTMSDKQLMQHLQIQLVRLLSLALPLGEASAQN